MTERKHETANRISRRRLLRLMAGAAALPWLGAAAWAGPTIRTRPIPSSGEQVPVVGLGTARTFDVGATPLERDPLRTVLRRFLQQGGSLVDTSPMYGTAESVIGDLLADIEPARSPFLATKVWTRGRDSGIRQMRRSMEKMGVESLDLIQVHNLVDWRTHLRTLRQWKEQGLVRYIGITHYLTSAHDELAAIIRREPLDFVQFNYSIATTAAENGLLPLAAERGVAVLINEPFEKGSLFRAARDRKLPDWAADFDCNSWAQFFLKYIIGHPAVTCPIPATSSPKHVVDNMQAGYGALPDEATRRRMARLVRAW